MNTAASNTNTVNVFQDLVLMLQLHFHQKFKTSIFFHPDHLDYFT